jgi:hypothetical protein
MTHLPLSGSLAILVVIITTTSEACVRDGPLYRISLLSESRYSNDLLSMGRGTQRG